MSRAAIYNALTTDPTLIALGFHGEPNATVLVNFDGDQRPSDTIFMALNYQNEDWSLLFKRSIKHLMVWVHCYREYSTDFTIIDKAIDAIDKVLTNLVQVDGSDGYTLTLAETESKSRDLRDDTYQTICRSVSYRILSRETVSA